AQALGERRQRADRFLLHDQPGVGLAVDDGAELAQLPRRALGLQIVLDVSAKQRHIGFAKVIGVAGRDNFDEPLPLAGAQVCGWLNRDPPGVDGTYREGRCAFTTALLHAKISTLPNRKGLLVFALRATGLRRPKIEREWSRPGVRNTNHFQDKF